MTAPKPKRKLYYRIKTIEHDKEIPLRAELFLQLMESFLVHLERYNDSKVAREFNSISRKYLDKAEEIAESPEITSVKKDKFQSETLVLIDKINREIAQLGSYHRLYPSDILTSKELGEREGRKISVVRAGLGALLLGATSFFVANVLDLDLGISWHQIRDEIWSNTKQTSYQELSKKVPSTSKTETLTPLKPVHPDELKRKEIIAGAGDLIDLINNLSVKEKDFEEKYGRFEDRYQELKKEAEKTIGGDGDPNDDDNLVKRLQERLAVKKIQRTDYILGQEIGLKSREVESLSLVDLAAAEKELSLFRNYLESVKTKINPDSESGQAYVGAHHVLSKKEDSIRNIRLQKEKQREETIQTLVSEIKSAIDKRVYIEPEFNPDAFKEQAEKLGNPQIVTDALQDLKKKAVIYAEQKKIGQTIEEQIRELYKKIEALNLDNNYQGIREYLKTFGELSEKAKATDLYTADDKAVLWLRDLVRTKMNERNAHIATLNNQVSILEKDYQSNQEAYQKLQQEILAAAENNSAVAPEKLEEFEKYEKLIKEIEKRLQESKTKLESLK